MPDRNERERDTMAILSNDGSNIETKLERVARRAASDPTCVFNNIGHVLDVDLLREQYWQLDGSKAVGIDKVTKEQYGENLVENLESLVRKIRRGSYRPQPSRLVEIPKEDGSKRPLAIACFEDKLVQAAASAILGKLYEPIFLSCSYGFRPKRSCHDALRALVSYTSQYKSGAVVEIDIRKYFNTIPQAELCDMLEKRISDKRFLKLLKTLMQTPTLVEGEIRPNARGCPQGSLCEALHNPPYAKKVIMQSNA